MSIFLILFIVGGLLTILTIFLELFEGYKWGLNPLVVFMYVMFFGATGTLLSDNLHISIVLILSFIIPILPVLIINLSVQTFIKKFQGKINTEWDLVYKTATVQTVVTNTQAGQILVDTGQGHISAYALSAGLDERFEVGTTVFVVALEQDGDRKIYKVIKY